VWSRRYEARLEATRNARQWEYKIYSLSRGREQNAMEQTIPNTRLSALRCCCCCFWSRCDGVFSRNLSRLLWGAPYRVTCRSHAGGYLFRSFAESPKPTCAFNKFESVRPVGAEVKAAAANLVGERRGGTSAFPVWCWFCAVHTSPPSAVRAGMFWHRWAAPTNEIA